jgi:hypothetical protein
VPVQNRDDGCRFAGNVDEDGRRGASVLGSVIDPGKHDERADRIEPEGDGQQHRNGGDGPNPRQNADQGADEAAQEREPEILKRERDTEAEREV